MIAYKLSQHFNQHGQNNGYSVEVSASSEDFDPDNGSISLERYQQDLDSLESMRVELLCINSSTSETQMRLLERIQDSQQAFREVTSALKAAREQYETLQAFLKAQGIKSMDNFPNLAVPKLTGELLEDEKKSPEW